MTVVTKVIRNTRYLYYQDSVSLNNHRRVVSTCIGNAELPHEKLVNCRVNAWQKHLIALAKLQNAIRDVPYHFEFKIEGIDNDILEYQRLIYQSMRRTLSKEEQEKFEKNFFVKYVHGTTAIEGNSLTIEEKEQVLTGHTTPPNKKITDAVEVLNYNDVKKLLNNWSEGITEDLIKQIHKHLMRGARKSNGDLIKAGEYRLGQAAIEDVWYTPPRPEDVPRLMNYLIEDYHDSIKKKVHPFELAVKFHQRFEEIHPFEEGNGRTGRAILNYMLRKYGLPEIYVPFQQRDKYLDVLEAGNVGDYSPLIQYIFERMLSSINFIVTKTNIFKTIISEEYKKLFIEVTESEDLYNSLMEPLIRYSETDETP